jgi:hypothetical protein
MTEKSKRNLAFLGVGLTVASFYVRNASAYPWLQALLHPSYANAKVGLDKLKKDTALSVGQPEFTAMAAVVESRLAEFNPTVPPASIIVKKLETTGGGIAFGGSEVRQTVGLRVTLFGQAAPLEMDLVELTDRLEKGWETRALAWGSVLLWVGVLTSVKAATSHSKPTSVAGLPTGASQAAAGHGATPETEGQETASVKPGAKDGAA